MDIRFDKPVLDFDTSAAGTIVTVTVSAWCGSRKYMKQEAMRPLEVGGPHWPPIIRGMHLDLLSHILGEQPPTDFTIRARG